jgi:hypothetical protein
MNLVNLCDTNKVKLLSSISVLLPSARFFQEKDLPLGYLKIINGGKLMEAKFF